MHFSVFFSVIRKAFPLKLFQLFRMCYPVFQDEAGHLAPTHLGVDNYRGRFPVFQGVELGRNDLYFPADFFPVEQVFHFTTGQVDKNASLLPDGINEIVRQQRAPVFKHGFPFVFRQSYIAFQAVILNTVQRAEQSV